MRDRDSNQTFGSFLTKFRTLLVFFKSATILKTNERSDDCFRMVQKVSFGLIVKFLGRYT